MESKNNNVIWEQKSNAPLNIWGLETGNAKLDRKVDGGIFSGGFMMFNGPVGPLAQLFMLALLSYFCILFFWDTFPVLTSIFVSFVIVYALYKFFIREIKYYQLAKNTIYQITKDQIWIKYAFLGFKKTVAININEISYLHEVEYEYEGVTKGSIWIYHDSEVKVYDVVKKERSVLPRIQMVQNHKEALALLQSLISDAKKSLRHQ